MLAASSVGALQLLLRLCLAALPSGAHDRAAAAHRFRQIPLELAAFAVFLNQLAFALFWEPLDWKDRCAVAHIHLRLSASQLVYTSCFVPFSVLAR